MWIYITLALVLGLEGTLCQELCSHSTHENKIRKCPTGYNVTERFQTLRDLAWFLTPRSYFLPNANEFTYRRLHEALTGKCAEDEEALVKMHPMAKIEMDTVRLSMKEGAHYLTYKCAPESSDVQGLWSEIVRDAREENVREWTHMEEVLKKIAHRNPHLYHLVQEFAHIRCDPHPFCQADIFGNTFCSRGSNKDLFKNWEGRMTWTDHISDTDKTGTAFMLSSCIDEKPSWAVFSIVPQQGRDNTEEFWSVAKEQEFRTDLYAWQNFNLLPIVPSSFFSPSKPSGSMISRVH